MVNHLNIFTPLNLPEYPVTLKKRGDKYYISCAIRKKELLLTPEEWVRQHFIHYLSEVKGYPKNLIAVEKQVKVNQLNKRFDVLVYNQNGKPLVLVECKAASVPLSQEVFAQAANYNMTLKVPYLIVTNGLKHIQASIYFDENRAEIDDELLDYSQLTLK